MNTADPDPLASDAAVALRELAWTIHRRAPQLPGEEPMRVTELAVLKQVIERPASTVGELGQALGLHQPNVSAAVRLLAERGLVAREHTEVDRRVVRVVPTDRGIAEHEAISAAWASPVHDAVGDLDATQRAQLLDAVAALRALHDALRRRAGETAEGSGPRGALP